MSQPLKKRPQVSIARPRPVQQAPVIHASAPPSTVASSVSSRRGSIDDDDEPTQAATATATAPTQPQSQPQQQQQQRVRIKAERVRAGEEAVGAASSSSASAGAGGGARAWGQEPWRPGTRPRGLEEEEEEEEEGEEGGRRLLGGAGGAAQGGYYLTAGSGGAGRLASLGSRHLDPKANKRRIRDLLWNEMEGLPSAQSVQLQALAAKRARGEKTSMFAAAAAASSASASGGGAAASSSAADGGAGYVPQTRVEVVGKNLVVVRESMQHNIKTLRGSSALNLAEDGAEAGGDGEDYAPSSGPAGGASLSGLPLPPPPGGRVSVLRTKKKHTVSRWTPEETKSFFNALRSTGLDFTLMEAFFPNRDRKQLKAKYDVEEKLVRSLVCLFLRAPFPHARLLHPFISPHATFPPSPSHSTHALCRVRWTTQCPCTWRALKRLWWPRTLCGRRAKS